MGEGERPGGHSPAWPQPSPHSHPFFFPQIQWGKLYSKTARARRGDPSTRACRKVRKPNPFPTPCPRNLPLSLPSSCNRDPWGTFPSACPIHWGFPYGTRCPDACCLRLGLLHWELSSQWPSQCTGVESQLRSTQRSGDTRWVCGAHSGSGEIGEPPGRELLGLGHEVTRRGWISWGPPILWEKPSRDVGEQP